MQEIIRFLSQGWVGTIVGAGGAALALFLYRRSRIPGIIAFQSHNLSMIGGSDAVFPSDITVLYRKTPVPRLTSSTLWFWNAGKKTVKGADIVSLDPLCFIFGGEVLNVRIKKMTRKAVQITADASGDLGNKVRWCFEFLDPGDGGIMEVLHTGSAKAPKCVGTIIGLPNGPQNWGRSWSSSPSSRRERRLSRLMFTVTLIVGIGISLTEIIGEQYINEVLPFLAELPELTLPTWPLIPAGLLLSLFSAIIVWILGRRPPSSLDVH